jgi:hypothetical protein
MPANGFGGIAKNQASLFRATSMQIGCPATPEGAPAPPGQIRALNLLADFVFRKAQRAA